MTKTIGVVEKKVLGALMILADDNMVAHVTIKQIAERMGYEKAGGAITWALRLLEVNNHIVKVGERRYKVLL